MARLGRPLPLLLLLVPLLLLLPPPSIAAAVHSAGAPTGLGPNIFVTTSGDDATTNGNCAVTSMARVSSSRAERTGKRWSLPRRV